MHLDGIPTTGAEAEADELARLRAEAAALRAELARACGAEAGYAALLQATGQIVWQADAEGRTLASPFWEPYSGMTAAEIRGWGWLDAIHPDDRPHVEARWRRSVATGEAYEAEARVRDATGAFGTVRSRGIPLREDGRVVGWLGVNEDVSDRVVELGRQRALLETVLGNLPCTVVFLDGERRVRFMNQMATAAMGCPLEAMIGRRLAEVSPALDAQFDAQLRAVYERGEAWRAYGLVYEVGVAGGASRTVCRDVAFVPVGDGDGGVDGVLLLTFDVTARAMLEHEVAARSREVERQKHLIERILAHAPVGLTFLDVDADWTVRWMNPAMARFLVRDVAEYEGGSLFAGRPRYRPAIEPLLRQVVETGLPTGIDGFAYDPPDGSPTRYCDSRFVPVFAADGVLDGVLGILLDVTARVAHDHAQQARIDQLREVDRLKDGFLDAMRRELRSPIEAIIGYASIVDDGVAGPVAPDQHRFLARIAQQADGLLATVDELLEMSRLQAGEVELRVAPFRFPAMVAAVVGAMMPLARARALRVTEEAPPDLPPLTADGPRLALVLRHLLGNAIKFSPEGGAIAVRVHATPAGLRCEVADAGPGIAPEDLPRLFLPFTQLQADDAPRVGGVGLGLTIVRALVDAHGGRVGVDGAPGGGSVFWFELPWAQALDQAAAGTPPG